MRWALVIVLVVASGCYRPNDASCNVACSAQDHTCPSGMACVGDQLCLAPGVTLESCRTSPVDGSADGIVDGTVDTPQPDADVLAGCPGDYTATSHGRYKLGSGSDDIGFVTSETLCESNLGNGLFTHLAAITSKAELDDIIGTFSLNTGGLDVWVGLSDIGHEGTWTHITNENPQFPGNGPGQGNTGDGWANQEPNGAMGENCGVIEPAVNGLFNDLACAAARGRLCECDTHQGIAPAPPAFEQPD